MGMLNKRRRARPGATLVALLLMTTAASAQDLLVRNATVHTASTRGSLQNADVLVQGGIIRAVGNGLSAPAGASVAATLPPEIVEAAAQLNGLSWQKLKAELAKGGIAKVVIKAALDLELAKPEPDRRGTTLKVLSQALEEA